MARHYYEAPLDELHTVRETAVLLKVCSTTVYRLIAEGCLRHSRVGRQIRVRKSDIQDYLNTPPPLRGRPLETAPDPARVVDMSVWQKSDAAMRRRKGLDAPETSKGAAL